MFGQGFLGAAIRAPPPFPWAETAACGPAALHPARWGATLGKEGVGAGELTYMAPEYGAAAGEGPGVRGARLSIIRFN